jgi:NodT family efflux transporter outer membrane factor (OMF) lipoprotein
MQPEGEMARRRHILIATICLAALAGCAQRPYTPPTTPTPTAYKQAALTSPSAKLPEGMPAAVPSDTWWLVFNDPVLDDLERRVDASNQDLAAAEAAVRQARAVVAEQQAGFFPIVELSGDASRIKSSSGTGSSGTPARSRAPVNSYNVQLGASWEPDLWGRVREQVTSAEANAAASVADLGAVRLVAQSQLATNYLQFRNTDAEIAVVMGTIEAFQRALKIAQNRYDAGLAPRADLLQAQSQLATTRAELEGLEQTRAQLEHAIAILVGQPPADVSLDVWLQADPPVPQIPAGVPSELLLRRPDIAAAERRVAAANATIGVAEADYFPRIVLTGATGFAASDLARLINSSTNLWSLGLSVVETVFDGGARSARTDQAKAAYEQVIARYRQTALTAFQEVENQLAAQRILAQQHELRRQASVAADEAERLALNQYSAGRSAYTEVIIAQVGALNARRSLAQVISNRQTAAVALIQALGGGWAAEAR